MSDLIIPQKYLDRIGEVNGKMTIINVVRTHSVKKRNGEAYSYIQAVTQCICGKVSKNNFSNLTLACVTCMLEERNGHRASHKMSNTPEFRAWQNAKGRCYNATDKDYNKYGGRGIKMTEKWVNNFEQFYLDMGPKPEPKEKYSLDRIDVNGDYEPNNCRWTTAYVQRHNRRPIHFKWQKICQVCGCEYLTIEPNNSMYCNKKCKMRGGYLKRKGEHLPFEHLKHICNHVPQPKSDDPQCNE